MFLTHPDSRNAKISPLLQIVWTKPNSCDKLCNNTAKRSATEGPGSGIDELTKVMYLYQGVKCPLLDNVRTMIFANEDKYRRDFPACVELYQTCITANSKASNKPLQVAALAQQNATRFNGNSRNEKRQSSKRNRNSNKSGKHGGNDNRSSRNGSKGNSRKIEAAEVTDRYYTNAEYTRFTPEAKQQLHDLRQRGEQPKKKVKVRFSNTSATQSSRRGDDDESSDESTSTPLTNNRNNPALTRQKSRRS
jgi:hypothetical protein